MDDLTQETRVQVQRDRLRDIRVISFDLDDTLWECAPVIVEAEEVLYGWLQQHATRITDYCSVDELLARRIDFARRHPEYRVDVTFLRKESLKALFAEFSYPLDLVEPAFEVFYHARSQVTLYAEANPVLESLKKEFKLSALTNGNADLALVGIDHLFDDIQHASLTNPPKPDSAMFHKTASTLGVEAAHILHVGDNPEADVQGGRKAGAMTVWFNQYKAEWPDHLPPADFEIDNLSTLTTIMRIS